MMNFKFKLRYYYEIKRLAYISIINIKILEENDPV